MADLVSIFLNKVKQFSSVDFEQFVSGFKKKYPKIKTMQSSTDKMIWGFFPKDTDAQFKYDPKELTLYTDLTQTQVYQFVKNS